MDLPVDWLEIRLFICSKISLSYTVGFLLLYTINIWYSFDVLFTVVLHGAVPYSLRYMRDVLQVSLSRISCIFSDEECCFCWQNKFTYYISLTTTQIVMQPTFSSFSYCVEFLVGFGWHVAELLLQLLVELSWSTLTELSGKAFRHQILEVEG